MKLLRIIAEIIWFLLVFMIVSWLFPLFAMAAWNNLGLYGGQVYEIAIDPSTPAKMFAGAYYGGGLYVTTNSGTNWTPVSTGLEGTGWDGEATFSNTAVWAVKIAPSNHNVVWAAHNYWAEKSTDGGATWTHILNSTMQGSQFRFCKSLAIHSTNSNIVYVGTAGPWTDTLAIGTIYKTTDGGTNWTNIGPFNYSTGYGNFYRQFPSTVVDIAVDSSNNIVWAITSNRLYRGINGGTTNTGDWTEINPGYSSFSALAIKPNEPNKIFIATGSGIYEYNNNTSSGGIISGGPSSYVRGLAFDPKNPNVLYVSWGGSYVSKGVWGSTWSWTQYAPGTDFLALTVHPSINTVVGGEIHLGVYQGVYNGVTYVWTQKTSGVNSIQTWDVASDPSDSSHLLAATEAGFFEKQGTSWTRKGSFLYTSVYSVAFDPISSSTYYAGTQNRLYKTTNGASSWTYAQGLSGYVNHIEIAADSSQIYITTRSSGNVYKSTNGGSTFSSIKPSGTFDYNAVVIDPADSNHIFAGGGNYFGAKVSGKLYESVNGGTEWGVILEGDNVIINALLIDPDDPDTIYAGSGWAGGTDIPLYKSTDGGTTWTKSYEGMPGEPTRYGIWGSSASDIFVLRHTGSLPKGGEDDEYISHYTSSWAQMDTNVSAPLYDMWGSSGSNVFAIGGSGNIIRYYNSAWSSMTSGTDEDLHGVWGNSGTSVFAAGSNGKILYFNGTNWSSMTSGTTADLNSVWGTSGTNVFAVGANGTILRYNGSWSQMTSGVTENLEDIWGSSASDIFAVGSAYSSGGSRYYTVLHSINGTNWSRMTTPAVPAGKSGKLRSIWGNAYNNVWAVGDDGVTLHYNGSTWSPVSSGTTAGLYCIWGSSSSNVYAVGLFGTVIKYNGSSWSPQTILINDNPDNAIWNAVTDLTLSPDGNLYASTERQGIFASANEGSAWINMGAPPYAVYAVTSGSVIVGGNAGAYTMDGYGILNGIVTNKVGTPIEDARVQTNLGKYFYTNYDGLWSMLHQAGSYNLTASKTGYTSYTYSSVPVVNATFTYVSFSLNSPPTDITLSNNTINENQPVETTIGTLSTADPDSGDTFTYTLVSGTGSTDNSSFAISGSTLRSNAIFNYEVKNSYSIRIRSTDSGGGYFEEQFTVSVININEAPTDISLSNSSIAENQSSGTTVGTFSTVDPDSGNTFTYTLVSGTGDTDNGSFTINGNTLRSNAIFDYETKSSYSIRVRTTDNNSLYYEKIFVISITSGNEAPTDISLSNSSIAENQSAWTTVGTFSTTDPDPGNTFAYTLVSGTGSTDNGSFTIAGDTLQSNAVFDYETKSSYSIRVRTTDQGSLWYEEAFVITVTNANETPTDIGLSNSSIAENQSAGTTVGTFSTTDPDTGDTFAYTLVSGTGSTDNSSFAISGSTLRSNAIFNYEVKNSYSIRVRTTDQGDLYYEESFVITVTNVNEAPVANNDTAITDIETDVLIDVTANDTDVDGVIDVSTVNVTDQPTHGTAVADVTGHVIYTPDADYSGDDIFTYTVNDNDGATSNEATVTVTISDVTPPSPPEEVTAVLTGTDSVVISWLPNIEDDLTGYKIYYGRTQGGPYPESSEFIPETDTDYTIEGMGGGTWYFVMVAQDNSGNQSDFSEEVSVRIVKSMPWLPLLLE